MSILGKIFNFGAQSDTSQYTSFFGFGGNSKSIANQQNSLTLSAFFNGVDQLSKDIAKMPKAVYIKTNRVREKQSTHQVNYLIATAPNDFMTAFDFWRVIVVLMLLKGEAFIKISRNKITGEVEFFDILDNEKIEIKKSKTTLIYTYESDEISSNDILHFKGFTLNGIRGISVIAFAAANLGVQLDTQMYSADIYSNRGLGYGVLESETDIANENKQKLVEGFKNRMSEKGPIKVAALDLGMKYKSISITPAEAQFLETGRFAIEDVARWLNMPVHKLKSLTNANFNTLEQQNIQYVVDCLVGWTANIENELNRKLFQKNTTYKEYVKFNEKVFLRGDAKTQAEFYTKMVYAGLMTRNEVRELEDLNPIDGLDEILTPVNMQIMSNLLENNNEKNNADG
ncbi:phage portal protein [Myroides sp. JBRI-B21084]|uniref:phage portal protein n=1 Tax=Myroides sp. JBRI-B21084 TaxID=3119977 RepID=UPI0026E4168F|nr:phage portal protein [Paenimyroides cloacae]WKW47269.1 phage portal protein [Paenimyroides cloacae]